MASQATLPELPQAFEVVQNGIDKRAFLECLQEQGLPIANAAEAEHYYRMGFKIAAAEQDPLFNKQAQQQNPGPAAFAEQSLDRFLGIKQASAPANPGGLDDISIAGALELASDPLYFNSALVIKAAQAQADAQQQPAS